MTEDLAAWLLELVAEEDRRLELVGTWNFPVKRAEFEAKRRMVEEHAEDSGYCRRCEWDADERDDPKKGDGSRWVRYPCLTLRLLAAMHAHMPDYREEWRP
jgi:hypothetical protein